MADTSLDDFFAKKDKSKKQKKTKKTTEGEDGSKAAVVKKEKKKDKDKQNTGGSGLRNVLTQEDEEWRDFEEEKEVDYTGLRIQNMQIAKEEQDKEAADAEEDGDDEDGESREKRNGASGPWNKSNDPTAVATPVPKKAAPEPVKEESPAPKVPGKYVPPGARNSSLSAAKTPSFPSRRPKVAPNMHSEEDFPTLGGGPGIQRYNQSGASDLIDHAGHRKGVNLTLENKFSALQD